MKHVTQPVGSRLCGQACVAMIADIDLDAAVALVGKKGATYTADLRKALANCGWQVLSPMLLGRHHAIPPDPADPILVRVLIGPKGKPHGRHFVVFAGHDVYDPELLEPMPRHHYFEMLESPVFGGEPWRIGGWARVVDVRRG